VEVKWFGSGGRDVKRSGVTSCQGWSTMVDGGWGDWGGLIGRYPGAMRGSEGSHIALVVKKTDGISSGHEVLERSFAIYFCVHRISCYIRRLSAKTITHQWPCSMNFFSKNWGDLFMRSLVA